MCCDWVRYERERYERVCGGIGDSSVVNTRMESLRQIYDTSVFICMRGGNLDRKDDGHIATNTAKSLRYDVPKMHEIDPNVDNHGVLTTHPSRLSTHD